jgi:hypothetical protein
METEVINLGMDVRIRFALKGLYGQTETVLHNVTEIHYCYPSVLHEFRIAFESDVHGTGYTYKLSDIAEFEAKVATERADAI